MIIEETTSNSNHSQENIAEAIRVLDRRYRRLSRAFLLTVIVSASAVVLGAALPRRTVEAERFVLRDSSGNARAELESTQPGCQLVLRDNHGREEATFLIDSIRAGIKLRTQQGKDSVLLQVQKGEPMLTFYDPNNSRRRLSLILQPDRGGMTITGANEDDRLTLLDMQPTPQLTLKGEPISLQPKRPR